MDADQIIRITRPHRRLLTYYVLSCLIIPPISFLALPFLFFRYRSMRYRFDEEGVSMSWGVLFRRQVNLAYSRIQDIHLTSGLIQRWCGLADIHIQTASGSATAEMKIEGILQYEELREFLYTRMRGSREMAGSLSPTGRPETTQLSGGGDAELALVLREIQSEVRQIRIALLPSGSRPDDVSLLKRRGDQ